MHQRINQLGFICMGQVWLASILYLSYHIYVEVNDGYNPEFQGIWITTVVMNVTILVHHLLGRKYKAIALHYSNVQAMVLFSCGYQQAISYNKDFQFFDRFLIILGYTASLAYISYCQKTLLFSFLITYCYLIARSWYWAKDLFTFGVSVGFFLAAFIFIYILARMFQHIERDKFQQKTNQNQLLKMFHNLIRRNHDGIIITQNEEIVFLNSQIFQIFNIEQAKDPNPENCDLLSDQTEEKLFLVEQFKKTTYEIQTQSVGQDEQCQQFQNIWEYILYRQEATKYSEYICCEDDKTVNGTYFQFHFMPKDTIDASEEEKTSKQLQVFSQIFQTGSKGLVMTTVRDMSRWLELEKQKTMSKMKTIAFASAAHEFRNPLNAITQSLELMNGLIDLSRGAKYYNIAKNCSNLMLYLVNDILDFSQLESKKFLLNLQDVFIQNTLDECISVLSFKAEEKGIDLNYEIDRRLPLYILVDQNRLRQILINLLSNGIKYTSSGYVKLQVKLDEENKLLKFNVIDTGVGIEVESQRRLFKAFTKIMKNREMNAQGCGLGLSISKLLAQALGGDISFESTYGQGSVFTLTLPFRVRDAGFNNDPDDSFRTDTNRSIIVKETSFKEFDVGSRTFQEETKSNLELINHINRDYDNINFNNLMMQFPQHKRQPTTLIYDNIPGAKLFKQSTLDRVDEYLKPTGHKLIDDVKTRNPSNATNIVPSDHNQIYHTGEDDGQDTALIMSEHGKSCNCAKILIVDDEPFNLIVLEGLLNQLGIYQIEKCFNGKEAQNKLVKNEFPKDLCGRDHSQYKLIITDNQMPIMTGTQLAKYVREEQQRSNINSNLKVVLLSGDYKPFKHSSESILFDGILLKPIKLIELQQVLSNYYKE
ncbi:multi-sensor hybrid histidine kinase [Stylonychia lemnae]|uniref:Multi-sensor hybrid histidine kinase n=1 Tax=Stylonychia lemnae TaxID=5949 RepID=A0A078A7J3_STYLE|nr:multi-sensor hybrid histidine kinase [Stylonychia lemnae]|eukprot:CDW78214.1 multi-sensor hybrid histidine kinase [Stylonychia lemnae]